MTVEQLKAYARAGLIARLDVLEREQRELRALLASITTDAGAPAGRSDGPFDARARATLARPSRTMSDEGRKRIGDAARRRWAAVRTAASEALAGSADSGATPEPDVARVLPRRGRSHRVDGRLGEPALRNGVAALPTPVTAPVLPPMPRLIKAQAS